MDKLQDKSTREDTAADIHCDAVIGKKPYDPPQLEELGSVNQLTCSYDVSVIIN